MQVTSRLIFWKVKYSCVCKVAMMKEDQKRQDPERSQEADHRNCPSQRLQSVAMGREKRGQETWQPHFSYTIYRTSMTDNVGSKEQVRLKDSQVFGLRYTVYGCALGQKHYPKRKSAPISPCPTQNGCRTVDSTSRRKYLSSQSHSAHIPLI